MASNVVIGEKTLQCNGKLMASDVVVDVGGVTPTGETWVINEEFGVPLIGLDVSVNFTSNGTQYSRFYFQLFDLYYDFTLVHTFVWTDQAYRTVTFETPPTGDLLTWLQDNAVKQ